MKMNKPIRPLSPLHRGLFFVCRTPHRGFSDETRMRKLHVVILLLRVTQNDEAIQRADQVLLKLTKLIAAAKVGANAAAIYT
jgi:hypothetical protein